ncbi:MAG: hypothetical protein ACRCTG_15475 [Aestuariivirga sp.]
MARRWHPRDALTTLVATQTAYTATQSALGGILDIGAGRADIALIVEVSAISAAGADQSYDLILQGSNSSTFASGIQELVRYRLGNTALRNGAITSVIGRYELDCSNELPVNGVVTNEFRYVRFQLVIAGTTPSITLAAWLTRDVAM